MNGETFTCAVCGGTFPMGLDEEARAELQEIFGGVSPEDCAMVCDDCWERVKP